MTKKLKIKLFFGEMRGQVSGFDEILMIRPGIEIFKID